MKKLNYTKLKEYKPNQIYIYIYIYIFLFQETLHLPD